MARTKREYRNGEIIFREGERSDTAFVIVKGRVALTKRGTNGPVKLGVLQEGELFGEMGILDEGRRTATAAALGEVVLDVVHRDSFLKSVRKHPENALYVMSKLADRLRSADEMLARSGRIPLALQAAGGTAAPRSPAPGWFARLFAPRAKPTSSIEVRIAPFSGPDGEARAKSLAEVLERRPGCRVKTLTGEPPLKFDAAGSLDRAALAPAREALRDSAGDLLVLGDVSEAATTTRLRFISLIPIDEDHAGAVSALNVLTVPAEIDDGAAAVLYAMVLAATGPANAGKAKTIRNAIVDAGLAAISAAGTLTRGLSPTERTQATVCLGNIAATVALHGGGDQQFTKAIEFYRRAVETLSRDDAPAEWGAVHKSLGCVLQHIADRTGDIDMLREAADAFAEATDVLSKRLRPRDWAAAQNRLGQALYKLDMESAEPDSTYLTRALSAYRAAMQVYTRIEAPERWADVMNSYAQAAQVLGEQLHDPEVLEKAVNACRSALEVRRRERTPFLWAATQNNLGSALFLLGKLTYRTDYLEAALDAFHAARTLYGGQGTGRMAHVTDRNLARVQRLLDEMRAVREPNPEWFLEEEPDEVWLPETANAGPRERLAS